MPYIKDNRRNKIYINSHGFGNDAILFENIQNAGELQYAMAVMINSYLQRNSLNYQLLNDVMGALSGADAEFYRKVVVPYEEAKEKENGPVYNYVNDAH